MFQPDQDGIYAIVQASAGRRWFGYAVLFSLGALVIYTTLSQPPALHWMIFMLVFGVTMLWLAERLRRATRDVLILYADKLVDSNGETLATLDEIESVDRGAFAFKPSNGFTWKLRSKKPRSGAPGLWWRYGRFLGVGGAVSAGQAKFMAEQIALRIK